MLAKWPRALLESWRHPGWSSNPASIHQSWNALRSWLSFEEGFMEEPPSKIVHTQDKSYTHLAKAPSSDSRMYRCRKTSATYIVYILVSRWPSHTIVSHECLRPRGKHIIERGLWANAIANTLGAHCSWESYMTFSTRASAEVADRDDWLLKICLWSEHIKPSHTLHSLRVEDRGGPTSSTRRTAPILSACLLSFHVVEDRGGRHPVLNI